VAVHYVLRPLALWWRYWPQLAAIYLVGLLARRGVIELAAWAGWDNVGWASLIMPLAGLVRLATYLGMFMVLRSAIPALAALPRRTLRSVDVFANIVAPFFAIYLAWQLFKEDWLSFETRALDYRVGAAVVNALQTGKSSNFDPESLPVSTVTWVLIAVALVLRYVLTLAKDRLPGWVLGVRVYLDALWIFLIASFAVKQGAQILVNPTGWLSQRRIVVWFNDTRAELFSHFRLAEHVWDALMWAFRAVFGGATIPLLWLAVAGIIYGVSMPDWRGAARRLAGARIDSVFDRATPAEKRIQERWSRIPGNVRDKVREWVQYQLGSFTHITDSARLILHAGVLALSSYVLAYLVLAWLDQTGGFYHAEVDGGYLLRGVAWVLGPHPLTFWNGVADIIATVSRLIVEPLRICLIASTVAYCLEHVQSREPSEATTTTAP
jgi:hypothetical protein